MLSLQQTQRFADVMAGAELARRRAGAPGEPFGVRFLVGERARPNKVKDDPKEVSPIHLLFHGDYLAPGDTVGARALGVLLPENSPEEPTTTETPRLKGECCCFCKRR